MNTNRSVPEKFVRAKHRTVRITPLLSFVAAGLAVTLALLWLAHPSFKPVGDWSHVQAIWLAGLTLSALGAVALWRIRRRTLLRTAAEADARFATHNRLETATALQSAQDAMARAQRAETEQFLQQTPLPLHRGWLSTFGLLAALLVAAHIATFICWARPVPAAATAAKTKSPAVVDPRQPAPKEPAASIEWVSPESETAATAIEEVPLEARADSESGLRNAVLELEVNGEHRLAQPLPDDLAKVGPHPLKLSLYLDQLEVKTYDIISYHLSADRITDGKLPPTSSPVQFVQVKPPREDTFICAGGDQPSKCFNYVTALKAAQLRLMKDNFTLAHAGVSHAQNEWRDENSRVGGEQNQLAARAGEVTDMMATNHYPEEILALVRESQPLMTDAGTKIEKQENQPALAPQGKALGHLTEVERYLKSTIKLAGSSTQPKAADPFQRPKNMELKTHPLTRAGKLDALAGEQSRLAGDLAEGNTNSTTQLAGEETSADAKPINGTPGERQSEIKQRISDFLNDPGMLPDALKHLQSGDDLAGKSLEQIDKEDPAAATEPAAEAARELHETAEALRAGGNDAAKNKLADALLKLSAAAGNVRQAAKAPSDAAAKAELKKADDAVHEAAQQLAEEARRQQDNGVTNAAARLENMAGLLQGDSLKQMLALAQQSPRDATQSEALARKLEELADRAAQQRNSGPLSRQETARLLEQLQRTQANIKRLASQCQSPGAGQSGKIGQSPSASPGQSSSPSPGQSPSPSTTQSPSPLSAKSSSPSPGQSPSPAPGQSPMPSPSSLAQTASPAPSANPPGGHALSPDLSRTEMQRAEAAQLLDDLRLSGADLKMATLDTVHLATLEDVLRQAANHPVADPPDFVPLAAELDPPLTGLIHSLQTELSGMRRPFELASKQTSLAPPAYRAAVADYFERLSRDYQSAQATRTNDAH